ncbi:MAG: SLC45 family MFS transporter [Bacteroidales bacterium]|nr:SLC45 family MFS transporter [Bacteroidales bacterium]
MLNIQKNKSNPFFVLLSLPSTAMGFALSVQISALSWILSTKYGLEIHEIGIVWAAGPIAGIIAQPIVGLISDKTWFMGGRRRPWIVIGSLLAALMLLALPNLEIIQKIFASGNDPKAGLLSIAVIVALLLDLSINVSLNPTRSLVADCTTLDERSKGYTWMQTISGSFAVLAYLIGGILGNLALIYIGAVITLGAAIIPAFLIEEPRHLANIEEVQKEAKDSTGKDILISVFPLLGLLIYGIYVLISKLFGVDVPGKIHIGNIYLGSIEFISLVIFIITSLMVLMNALRLPKNTNEYQKVLLAHAFTWVGVQTMFIYAFFFLSQKMGLGEGAGKVNSLAFFLLSLVSAILPAFVLNPIAKKIGMVRTHYIAIFIMAIGYAGIFFLATSPIVYYVFISIAGIGWGSVVSLPFAIMSEKVDQTKMGLYMGIFNLSVVLPQLVASFKMGEVVNNAADKSVVFAICTITLAISGLLWMSVKNEMPAKFPKGEAEG